MSQLRVPFMDLRIQAEALREASLAAFTRVYDSGRFILGSEVQAFEQEVQALLGGVRCVGVSNGTDALVCALSALKIGSGHRVLTTPLTFFATASAILRTGAQPVFADVDERTYNLSLASCDERAPAPDAVIAVHLFGRPLPITPLRARFAGVPIIEDAAQAFGAATPKGPVGTLGRLGCFSFFPAKPLGACGDAGMVVTNDPELEQRCRQLRVHGRGASGLFETGGGNYRLDAVQAALLRVKLPLVQHWQGQRRANASFYRETLADLEGLILPPSDDETGSSAWSVFSVRVPARRDALRRHLAERGIETAVYYPQAVHLQPALQQLGYRRGQFPVAERLTQQLLALPVGPELEPAQRHHVVEVVRAFFGG